MDAKPFLITTPIPYTNAAPHMGHLLEGIFNDTIARFYRRLYDGNVNLTMGLDQHGLKIYQEAQKAKQEPEIFVQEQGKTFVDLWKQFEVQYDSWVPTTSKEHRLISQLFWRKLSEKGAIYKKSYTGLYNIYDEVFVLEKELDKNGDLPGRPGVKPVQFEEENYFFALTHYKDALIEYLKKTDIRPEGVKQEMLHLLNDDLQDISFSRDAKKLPWGIPVPGDPTQVIYVWCDALINYATACVNLETVDRWYEIEADREEIENELWKEIRDNFPIDLMYVGKDIVRFHLLYWPAILMCCDVEPPVRCLVHGHINASDGRKMSKSLGNGVTPQELIEKFGVDGTRFIILHDVNIFGDTHFDWNTVIESYNAHLANNIGNLLMRVTTLAHAHYPNEEWDIESIEQDEDFSSVYDHMNMLDPRSALECILEAGRKGNEILEQTKPWTMVKEGKKADAKKILALLLKRLAEIGSYLSIFLPESGEKIYRSVTAETVTKAEPLFKKVETLL